MIEAILFATLVVWCLWLTRIAFKTRMCLAEIAVWIKNADAELDRNPPPPERETGPIDPFRDAPG